MHNALVTNGRLCEGRRANGAGAWRFHWCRPADGQASWCQARHRLFDKRVEARQASNMWRRSDHRSAATDWVGQITAANGDRSVDLVIDQAGNVNDAMRVTAIRGRIVNVDRLDGDRAEFAFDLHALRRIDYVGVTFRTRSVNEVRALNRALQENLCDAIAAGLFRASRRNLRFGGCGFYPRPYGVHPPFRKDRATRGSTMT